MLNKQIKISDNVTTLPSVSIRTRTKEGFAKKEKVG